MSYVKCNFRQSAICRKEGTIVIQVTYKRKTRQIETGLHIYPHEWNKAQAMVTSNHHTQRSHHLADIRRRLLAARNCLNRIITDFECKGISFDIDDIINQYHRTTRQLTLFYFMEDIIAQLKLMDKLRTAETYHTTLRQYRKFRRGEDIRLEDITAIEMQHYETYMANRGICPNTSSFYMRILRATYNRAVAQGLTEQKYPFKQVYTGVRKTRKRAISISDIQRIKHLDLTDRPALALARDAFLFSFYTRGMAFVDIAHLRKNNIRAGNITYRRRKTGQQLTIKIEKCTQEIINRYLTPGADYVFPFIKTIDNSYQQYKNALRLINYNLKTIGRLSDTTALTTYVARHSWGSAAKASNIPLAVISESMGHDSEHTTQIYLASLDTAVIDRANAKILKKLQ